LKLIAVYSKFNVDSRIDAETLLQCLAVTLSKNQTDPDFWRMVFRFKDGSCEIGKLPPWAIFVLKRESKVMNEGPNNDDALLVCVDCPEPGRPKYIS
jgi:hypothetical protein